MQDYYQKFIRHVLMPASLWRSGDLAELRYLRELERSQFLSREKIVDLQHERLARLVAHAYEYCPFHRRRFDEAGLHPSDVRETADLVHLPVLEKRDVQENRDSMVAENWPRADLIQNQTGGSTGQPVSFFLSHERKWSRSAATIRHNRWAHWDIGDRVAYIWGAPQDLPTGTSLKRYLRERFLHRQLFLDTGQFTEESLVAFHEQLKRFRPRVILAYTRGAVLMARYLRSRSLTPYQPRSIVTSAEMLEPEDRRLIEETFGSPVFNRYGCREFSVLASECERHNGLHTMAEYLLIEVVRPDGTHAAAGEVGSILVTDLHNHAMPMIRYRIGDMGAWAEGDCPCGRGLPRLEQLAGRVTDFLLGSDGKLVSGVFLATYLVAQRPSLGQVQIWQDRPGAIHYKILRGSAFREPDDLDYLVQCTRRYLGEDVAVTWEFVGVLRSEASGKFLFSRSTVTPEYLRSTGGAAPALSQGDRR